jgi:hypothetical protein
LGLTPQTFQWIIKIVIMVIVNLIVNIVKHQARDITRHALLEHVRSPPSVDSAPPLAFVRAWPWVGVIFPESHRIPALCGQSSCPKPQKIGWPWMANCGLLDSMMQLFGHHKVVKHWWSTRCGAENSTSWPKWLLFLGQQKIKKKRPKVVV